jgi:hypothetical protein
MANTVVYRFCENNQIGKVFVTADFGNCATYSEYTAGVCFYQTWKTTIKFTVDDSAHPELYLEYMYYQEYSENDAQTFAGWLQSGVVIPAGVVFKQIQVVCKENRFCSDAESGGYNTPLSGQV